MRFPLFFKNKSKTKLSNKPVYYPVCPKCLNPRIKPVSEFTSGWLTTPRYYCSFCHYSGTIILEIDISLFETKTPQEIKKMFLEGEGIDEKEENFSTENFEQ